MRNIILLLICVCSVATAFAQAPKKRPTLFDSMLGTWIGPKSAVRIVNPEFCKDECNTISIYIYDQKPQSKEDSLNLSNGNLYPDYEITLVYRMYDLLGTIDYRAEAAIVNYKDSKKPSRASLGQSVYVDESTIVIELLGEQKQFYSFNISNGILYWRQGYEFTSYSSPADVKENGLAYKKYNGGK